VEQFQAMLIGLLKLLLGARDESGIVDPGNTTVGILVDLQGLPQSTLAKDADAACLERLQRSDAPPNRRA
jgi:hypothetical protein